MRSVFIDASPDTGMALLWSSCDLCNGSGKWQPLILQLSEEERQRCETDGDRIRDIDQYSSLAAPHRFKERGGDQQISFAAIQVATTWVP